MNCYNHANVKHAKQLRKEMTPWESKLWYCYLNKHAVRFYRQKPIGKYIADFYSAEARLVIELDGSQHYEAGQIQPDQARTNYFQSLGLTVVRYTNADINLRFKAVCQDILTRLPLEGKLSPEVTDEVVTEDDIG